MSLLQKRTKAEEVVKEVEPEVKAAFAFEDPKFMSID